MDGWMDARFLLGRVSSLMAVGDGGGGWRRRSFSVRVFFRLSIYTIMMISFRSNSLFVYDCVGRIESKHESYRVGGPVGHAR